MWKSPDIAKFIDHHNHSIEIEPRELQPGRTCQHETSLSTRGFIQERKLTHALAVGGTSFVHTFVDTNASTQGRDPVNALLFMESNLTVCFKNLKMFLLWDQAVHLWDTILKGKTKAKQNSYIIKVFTHTQPTSKGSPLPIIKHKFLNKAVKIFIMQSSNCGNKDCNWLLPHPRSESLSPEPPGALFRPHF